MLTNFMVKVSQIGSDIEELSEPALKGLAHELRRCRRLYEAERGFYDAAAAAADHQREIKARHRAGRGARYAVLRIMNWNDTKTEARELDTIEEHCESKPAAVETAAGSWRRMPIASASA
ncbi:hypothetical protein [Methylobacterium planeticum]|uniref:Uncharacterized protein n=1 Tax=Methylobacterium planeticum TaxID=2615211 RepID=A0A6N6MM32_9HYPH|nr:hypothetical protein [Methylobacterium planeticum]KAB1071166.1 hypothetical protein F6X51_19900 [Methylobacterium planeticum]